VVWVTLSLGSNKRPYENFSSCLDTLLLQFQDLALSFVFESQALKQPAANYLNMAVGFETDMSLKDLAALIKKIEDKHDRQRQPEACSQVTLDIDLLTYGDKTGNFDGLLLPHPDITKAAYVLWPLSQIAGKRRHPQLNRTFLELWQEFAQSSQQVIAPVTFEWHGRVISKK
jgi:2-amino-4-hydroxy-6-hydroxymethyldihydropteridine diphosphokinase